MSKLALNQQLWKAVTEGNGTMIEAALVAGADPDFRDNGEPDESRHQSGHARSVLHEALLLGQTEGARILLRHGAEQACDGLYELAPLHLASLFGHEDLLKYMLELGGDPHVVDGGGDSLLMTALMGEDPYNNPGQPIPAKQNEPQLSLRITRILVDAGVDLNQPNEAGETPLWNAVRYHDAGTVQALVDLGANPHVETVFGTNLVDEVAQVLNQADAVGQMPWRVDEAKQIRQRALEILKTLHAMKVDIANPDSEDESELHYPSNKIKREIVSWWAKWDSENGRIPSIRNRRKQLP